MAKKTLHSLSTNDLHAELIRREKAANRLASKREKLLTQVAEIDAELAEYGYEVVGGGGTAGSGRGGRKRPKNETNLVEVLAQVMNNKTMGVTEAAEAAQKAGYTSSSANFRNIVNQTLLKNPDVFKKVSRGQYTAK